MNMEAYQKSEHFFELLRLVGRNVVEVQTFDDNKQRRNAKLADIFPHDVNKVRDLQSQGAGIFWPINPMVDANKRGYDYVSEWSGVGLDLDCAKQEQGLKLDEVQEKKKQLISDLANMKHMPTFIIVTRNGLQPVWLFKPRPITAANRTVSITQYRQLVKSVGDKIGYQSEGDNLARVLRFPGSYHLKDINNPYLIRLLNGSGTLVNFDEFFDEYYVEPEKWKPTSYHWDGWVDANSIYNYPLCEALSKISGHELVNGEQFEFTKEHANNTVNVIVDGRTTGQFIDLEGNTLGSSGGGASVNIVNWVAWYHPACDKSEIREQLDRILKNEWSSHSCSSTNQEHQPSAKVKIDWPGPLVDRAYYGLAGEVVKAIEPHSEADPVALLVNFLTAFGSVVGDNPYFRVEADKHPMRLFSVLVGKTSKARKGTSWGYLRNLFNEIDESWSRSIQSGLSSGEGLIWAVRDKITKSQPVKRNGITESYEDVIQDQGINDKRLLLYEAEFASTLRVLDREGNTLSAIIRNAWDTGNLQSLTKNSQARATGAHISIIGHITRDELLRYLTSTEAANGFGNRYLWFCVKRSKNLPFGGNLSATDFEFITSKVREAVEFAKNTSEIKWAQETRPMWAEIYVHLSEGNPGLIGALTARGEAYVARLACIYALLDKSVEITQEHLLAAVAVWDYVEASVKYIFQDKTADPIANQIIKALTQHPEGMTRTDISKYFGKNRSAEQLSAALETLRGLEKVRSERAQTEGRSSERWFLVSQDT